MITAIGIINVVIQSNANDSDKIKVLHVTQLHAKYKFRIEHQSVNGYVIHLVRVCTRMYRR